jgi:KDO2-lipid IV(A) lauroyltransferase
LGIRGDLGSHRRFGKIMAVDIFRHDGPFWRKAASFGATRAPRALVRYSPPAWALAFALAMPAARARVRRNLRWVLGRRRYDEETVDVLRTFSNFASCFTEGLAMGASPPPDVDCVVQGDDHLRAAIHGGRGVILVTAHTGGWETAGPLLKKKFNRDVMIVMEREVNAEAREVHDRARDRAGVKVFHVGSEPLAILTLLSHVRRGGILGLQIDRAPNALRSFPVSLFGTEARVPSGPFLLARAADVPILPVFTRRRGFFRYEISLSAPLDIPKRAPDAALARAAERAAAEMERFIRAHPTHWFDFGRES